MDDTATHFLANGGPAVARAEISKLAEVVLIVYADGREAYFAAMEKIRQAEIREAEEAERRDRDSIHDLIDQIAAANMGQRASGRTGCPEAPQPGSTARPAADGQGGGPLTGILDSQRARRILQRLQQAGLLDESLQPVKLTRREVALMAERINFMLSGENERLLGSRSWKPYEALWRRKNMKADYRHAGDSEKTPDFLQRLQRILADMDDPPPEPSGSSYR